MQTDGSGSRRISKDEKGNIIGGGVFGAETTFKPSPPYVAKQDEVKTYLPSDLDKPVNQLGVVQIKAVSESFTAQQRVASLRKQLNEYQELLNTLSVSDSSAKNFMIKVLSIIKKDLEDLNRELDRESVKQSFLPQQPYTPHVPHPSPQLDPNVWRHPIGPYYAPWSDGGSPRITDYTVYCGSPKTQTKVDLSSFSSLSQNPII